MRRGKNMSIGDQYTPAILNRALSEKSRHPRPLFRVSRLTTRDSDLRFRGRTASSGSSRFSHRFLNIGRSRVFPRNCVLVVGRWSILVLVFVPLLLVVVEICGKSERFEVYTLHSRTQTRGCRERWQACMTGNVYREGARLLRFHRDTLGNR